MGGLRTDLQPACDIHFLDAAKQRTHPIEPVKSLLFFAFSIPKISDAYEIPAHSIGSAVFVCGTALAQVWLQIVAPIIRGVLAGIAFRSGLLDGPGGEAE